MDTSGGKAHPRVLHLAPAARAAWASWYNAHADEANAPGFEPRELSVDGKLCDFAARFVLILHLLHLAVEPARGPLDPIPSAPEERVCGAIELWRYFRMAHRRARWYMDGGVGNPSARCILDWARRNCLGTFREADVADDLRWLAARPDEMGSALNWLVEAGAIRPIPEGDRPLGKRGRHPSPAYQVRPGLLAPRNTSITDNSGP